jgi:hypothetical protein
VERDFGPIQHHEQFAFVGMEPREQAVAGDEPVLRLKIGRVWRSCPTGL